MPPKLSQASLFGRGGGGTQPPAISPGIQALIRQQQMDQSKLLKNVQKLQEENQLQNQEAREAGASGMTEVANQITSALDARAKGQEKKRDRVESLQQQQDFAQFQAELNQDSQREAVRIGEGIRAQREAVANFTESFRSKKNTIKSEVAVRREQLRKMLDNGLFFRTENGLQEYSNLVSALDDVDAAANDHFSDDNLAEVYAMQNQITRKIIGGDETMDLANLRVDPLLLPLPDVIRSGRTKPKLTGEERFQRKLTEGYPLEGTLANPPQPGEVPPKLITPEFLLDVLMKDQELTGLVDEKNRRKLVGNWKRTAIKTNRILMEMKDNYESMNLQTATMAPQAVRQAMAEFMALEDPNKFAQMPRLVTALAMKHMFPENGDRMSGKALDLFDGKVELKTTQEAMEGMLLESASFAIQKTILNLLKTPQAVAGKAVGGAPLVEELIQQLEASGGKEAVFQFADFTPLGDATDALHVRAAIMRKLTGIQGFASRMSEGLKHTSALEGFRQALSKNVREIDLLATHHLLSESNDRERALKMLDTSFGETARGLSLEQVEGAAGQEDLGLAQSLNMMDALILHAQEMGPDTLREVAHAISGGVEDISTPNMKTYEDSVKRGGGDVTTQFMMEKASLSFNRRREARQKKAAQKEQGPPGDPSKGAFAPDQPVGESFQKGGVVPATTNIAGKILGTTGGAIQQAAQSVGRFGAKALGGERLESAFMRSVEEGRKRFGSRRNKGNQ